MNDAMTKPQAPSVNFSVGSERTVKKVDKMPGPCDYNPGREFGDDLPDMTIRKRRDMMIDYEVVGPGTYAVDRAMKLTKSSAIEVDFSKAPERPQSKCSPSPGPCDYDPEPLGDSPSFSIGLKPVSSPNY